jgi:hypothetical protein
MALAILGEKPMSVASAPTFQIQEKGGGARTARVLDANPPRALGRRCRRPQVAAKVDEERYYRSSPQYLERPVDRVLLADAAKIDLHAIGKDQRGSIPTQSLESNEGQETRDRVWIREPIRAIEVPRPSQDAGGDIEEPAAQFVTVACKSHQRTGLLIQ